MKYQGWTESIVSRLGRAPTFFPPMRLLPLLSLALVLLLVSILAAPDSAQAADQLWFKSAKGEWAVTSGVAADDIGRALARGVPKTRIRYSIEGADGFSIGRRSGRVSYDGTSISGEQVSLTVTARDKNGEAASASRVLEVSVTQPEPDAAPTSTPTPEPSQPAEDGASGQDSGDPGQAVDNVAPTVSSLRITSTPAAHGSYAAGENITVEVTFSEPVFVTGAPCLLINVGRIMGSLDRADEDRQKRPAAYASGSGTSSLRFSYTVVTGDRDRVGVGVYQYGRENPPLRLSCTEGGVQGTIRDGADNDSDLVHRWLEWDAGHKVGGPDVYPDDRTSPTITGLAVVSSPASGDTYRDGETILVRATFSEPVVVDASPRMGIWMGRYRKEMTYRGGSGTNQLTLGYTVRPEDSDGDGISTFADMILVYGDLAVTDSADNEAKAARKATCAKCATTLEHGPLATQSGHKVAGSASDTTLPTVQSVGFGSTQDTYLPGDEIRLHAFLSETVMLEGLGGVEPRMDFTIGGNTRTARWAPYNSPTTSWLGTLHFTYTVQDGDGGVIAVGAGSVKLPAGASVRDEHDNLTTALAHPAHTRGAKVPAAYILGKKLSITSSPAEGDTYRAGETITISVKFSSNVTVTGTPSIPLRVDPNRLGHPSAQYSGGSGTNTLTFDYVVARGITARRGIEVPWWVFSIELGGDSSIKAADGSDANLAHNGLAPQEGHKVDGR